MKTKLINLLLNTFSIHIRFEEGLQRMQFIYINVSGLVFQVSDTCLERFPNTLLGDPFCRANHYILKENIYFFDRHRLAFEGILMYYQSYGRVVCPDNVPDAVFEDELEFFRIDCEYLREAQDARRFVTETLNQYPLNNTLQIRVWHTLKEPDSSKVAQALSIVSLVMTVASIFLVCISPNKKDILKGNQQFFPLEVTCFTWFSIEYLLRLWSTPSKLEFVQSWIDTTDLITLIVFYCSLALSSSDASSTSVLRVFRLANAFRVFRLTRFSNGFRLLIYTIYKSRTDLQLLGAFLAFFILISGSLIYFAEDHPKSDFKGGIFDGIWFSVISCTTVGYGDIVPKSPLGKFTAALIISFGAMFILLPVLKLVNSFSDALTATRALLNGNEIADRRGKLKVNMQKG